MTPAEKVPTDDQFGPAKIAGFDPTLTPKTLVALESGWYAAPKDQAGPPPDEVATGDEYLEGALRIIQVNAYERNAEARKACLSHFGVECQVCGFDFEQVYGELGTSFIHVHHIVPLSEIGKTYQVDPIKDLVPVCPNCHAMIHRTRPALSLQELKEQMRRTFQVKSGNA
jgi:5-methylcytosine-specific restriction protein A